MKIKHIIVICDCGKEVTLNKLGSIIDYYTHISGTCECGKELFVWADEKVEVEEEVKEGLFNDWKIFRERRIANGL